MPVRRNYNLSYHLLLTLPFQILSPPRFLLCMWTLRSACGPHWRWSACCPCCQWGRSGCRDHWRSPDHEKSRRVRAAHPQSWRCSSAEQSFPHPQHLSQTSTELNQEELEKRILEFLWYFGHQRVQIGRIEKIYKVIGRISAMLQESGWQ